MRPLPFIAGVLVGVLTTFTAEFVSLWRLYRRIDGEQKRRKQALREQQDTLWDLSVDRLRRAGL